MTIWFQDTRMEWAAESVEIFGFINRRHLMQKFGVSNSLAASDLARLQFLNPHLYQYNGSKKRLEKSTPSIAEGEMVAASNENDTFESVCLKGFVEEQMEFVEDTSLNIDKLFKQYHEWAATNNAAVFSAKQFTKELKGLPLFFGLEGGSVVVFGLKPKSEFGG